MRCFFLFSILCSSLGSITQDFVIENAWKKDSKFVYIGLMNNLYLKGDLQKILNVTSPDASINRSGDTVFVRATTPGHLRIQIEAFNSTETFVFQSTYLPPPTFSIASGKYFGKSTLPREDVLQTGGLTVSSSANDEDKLYDNFSIVEYSLTIADKTYQVSGNYFSKEVMTAISNLSSGAVVTVEKITLRSNDTGRILRMIAPTRFTIL